MQLPVAQSSTTRYFVYARSLVCRLQRHKMSREKSLLSITGSKGSIYTIIGTVKRHNAASQIWRPSAPVAGLKTSEKYQSSQGFRAPSQTSPGLGNVPLPKNCFRMSNVQKLGLTSPEQCPGTSCVRTTLPS